MRCVRCVMCVLCDVCMCAYVRVCQFWLNFGSILAQFWLNVGSMLAQFGLRSLFQKSLSWIPWMIVHHLICVSCKVPFTYRSWRHILQKTKICANLPFHPKMSSTLDSANMSSGDIFYTWKTNNYYGLSPARLVLIRLPRPIGHGCNNNRPQGQSIYRSLK
jgi:hypothetical protein